jgi:hypothetical protein
MALSQRMQVGVGLTVVDDAAHKDGEYAIPPARSAMWAGQRRLERPSRGCGCAPRDVGPDASSCRVRRGQAAGGNAGGGAIACGL